MKKRQFTERNKPVQKTDKREFCNHQDAYKYAYQKHNYSFSTPKAPRVSIAEEEAKKRLKNPPLGTYDLERGLRAMSRSPSSSILTRRRC